MAYTKTFKFLVFLLFVIGLTNSITYLSSCGKLDVAGETYILNQDISASSDSYFNTMYECFTITADNIVLDGNGYRLIGPTSSSYTGIYLESVTGVTVKNFGNIQGFYNCISLFSSSYNNIQNNVISNCGEGIYTYEYSGHNTFSNNQMYANSIGMRIFRGGYDTISSNTIQNGLYYAIILDTSDNEQITGNTISRYNEGITISSSYNTVSGNTLRDNTYAINLHSSATGNNIENNVLCSNTYGVYSFSSSNSGSFNTGNYWYNWADSGKPYGFTYACGAPFSVTLLSPPDNSKFNTPTVDITFKYSGSKMASCSLYVNGNSVSTNPSVYENTNTVLTTPSYSQGNFNAYVRCTYANASDTSNTISFSIDTVSPYYSNILEDPPSPINYSPNQTYQFNATWLDSFSSVDTVLFESNFSGTLQTYSTTKVGNIYTYTTSSLPAGSYVYRWYANDTYGNENYTPYYTYEVVKLPTNLTMNASPSWNVTYPEETNVSCSTPVSTVDIYLYRDGTLVASGNSYVEDLFNHTGGNHTYKCYTPGSIKYYSKTIEEVLIVNKATPSLTLNAQPSWNVTYPEETNVSCSASTPQVIINLYRNGTLLASGRNYIESLANLSAGTYAYVCNTSGSENYTSNEISNTLTINKATPSLTLNAQPSWNVTYPEETNVSCSASTPQVIINLYRNGTLLASGRNYIESLANLSAGTYAYVCNTSGSENYTSNEISNTLTINKATPPLNITMLPSNSTFYPTETNVSCSAPQNLPLNLYRNGTLVASGNGYVEELANLSIEIYNYTCNTTGNENYTNYSILRALEITPLPPKNKKKINNVLQITSSKKCPENKLIVSVEADNNPVRDAKVILSIKQGSIYYSISTKYTDSDGNVEFTLTQDGDYKIIVYSDDYDTKSKTFSYSLCQQIINETNKTIKENETANETISNETTKEKEEKNEKKKEKHTEEPKKEVEIQKEETPKGEKEATNERKPLGSGEEKGFGGSNPANQGETGKETPKTIKGENETCYTILGLCYYYWIPIGLIVLATLKISGAFSLIFKK